MRYAKQTHTHAKKKKKQYPKLHSHKSRFLNWQKIMNLYVCSDKAGLLTLQYLHLQLDCLQIH